MFSFKELILFILVTESAIFSFVSFMFKPLRSSANKFYIALLCSLGLMYLMALLNYSSYVSILVNLQPITFFLFLIVNPLFILYVKSLTIQDFKLSRFDYARFVPGLLVLTLLIVLYLPLTDEEKTAILSHSNDLKSNYLIGVVNKLFHFTPIIYFIQIITNCILVIKYFRIHKKSIEENFSDHSNKFLNWLKVLVVFYFINAVLEFIAYYLFEDMLNNYIETIYYILLLVTINLIGFFGLKQKDIFLDRVLNDQINGELIEKNSNVFKYENNSIAKYSKSNISEELKLEIIEKLNISLNDDKIYLQRDLTLEDLANYIGTHKNYLSQVINEKFGLTFHLLINTFRVQHAIALIQSNDHQKYSLEGIAQISGFNSRYVLNTAFKKITGKTPSEFKVQ